MNNFEKVAIFTAIENIENQLRGLKVLITTAAGANAPAEHKVTKTISHDDDMLTEDEETELERAIKEGQARELKRMEAHAQAHLESEWDTVSNGIAKVNSALNG